MPKCVLAQPRTRFPVGRGQQGAYIRRWREFGRICAARNGALLRHVSTADTARDLNLMHLRSAQHPGLRVLGRQLRGDQGQVGCAPGPAQEASINLGGAACTYADELSSVQAAVIGVLGAVTGCALRVNRNYLDHRWRLTLREAILAGGSSGAVMMALEMLSSTIPYGRNCDLILPDGGDRYLDTICSDNWVSEHFGEVSQLWKDDESELEGTC